MLKQRFMKLALVAAALVPSLAATQTGQDPRKEEMRRQIGTALTELIGDSSRTVAEKLLAVRPDGAISKNFDVAKVTRALFGRNVPTAAPDCRTTATAAREADTGMCLLEFGNRDGETGAYTMLSYSRNIGIGELQFARRPAFDPKGESLPKPDNMTELQAYNGALQFLELVGVPKSEIPMPPAGMRLPVRDLVVAAADQDGKEVARVSVEKVVSIPRAFFVADLYKDPSGRTLNHVIAPGGATIAMADGSVMFARIDGWSDAQIPSKQLDPRMAKTTTSLTDEIVDDLHAEGVRTIGSLSILIALRKGYPNPDDPDPPLCPVCGWLLPAVRVIVSQPGVDPVESSEKAWVAPGLVREYDLIDQSENASAVR